MKLYHTFESNIGFDLDKTDFERGIFTIKPWWVGKKGYEKYSAFHPNEFGDKVVELDVDDSAKTYTSSEQLDLLKKFFPDSIGVQKIIDKYSMGDFGREDWQKMDKFIGKFLRKKGYQLIHYTDTDMYGDEWAIIDKNIINGINIT